LNNTRLQAEGFSIFRPEVDSCSVIPAEAGIQAVLEVEPKTNLDAGVRRHDELLLRLKAMDFNHPRKGQ
jgi:hypothetical protein